MRGEPGIKASAVVDKNTDQGGSAASSTRQKHTYTAVRHCERHAVMSGRHQCLWEGIGSRKGIIGMVIVVVERA